MKDFFLERSFIILICFVRNLQKKSYLHTKKTYSNLQEKICILFIQPFSFREIHIKYQKIFLRG